MNKKIESMDDIRPNVFEALKRAYIKRGIVPRRYQSKDMAESMKVKDNGSSHQETAEQKKQLEPKLSADAEKPREAKQMGEKRSLTKPPQDSKSAKGPSSLVELTENSQDILYEATTIFPLNLFPDTITLDREKITIANRTFWRTATITSTPISEVMTVEANVGPFFGSIHLTFRFFADNQRTVNYLTRKDVTMLQRLLHGYIIAHRREIDCSNIDLEDLKTLLLELGQGASD